LKQPDEFGPDLIKPATIRLPLVLHQMGELGWVLHIGLRLLLEFQIHHLLQQSYQQLRSQGFIRLC